MPSHGKPSPWQRSRPLPCRNPPMRPMVWRQPRQQPPRRPGLHSLPQLLSRLMQSRQVPTQVLVQRLRRPTHHKGSRYRPWSSAWPTWSSSCKASKQTHGRPLPSSVPPGSTRAQQRRRRRPGPWLRHQEPRQRQHLRLRGSCWQSIPGTAALRSSWAPACPATSACACCSPASPSTASACSLSMCRRAVPPSWRLGASRSRCNCTRPLNEVSRTHANGHR